MHRVHLPDAAPPSVVVTGNEAHHLARVLRLRVGDDVIVFDGRGHEWSGTLSSVSGTRAVVDGLEARAAVPESPIQVTLGIAMLKGDQMDAVVRDATMMGVAAIRPFVSAHVAVPERAWRHRSVDRWRRIAIASARQCRRAVVPDIRDVAPFAELFETHTWDAVILCAEPALTAAAGAPALVRGSSALVLVGPEGGWATEELDRARDAGAYVLNLGPRTLRAEAAPVVALTALSITWGWQ